MASPFWLFRTWLRERRHWSYTSFSHHTSNCWPSIPFPRLWAYWRWRPLTFVYSSERNSRQTINQSHWNIIYTISESRNCNKGGATNYHKVFMDHPEVVSSFKICSFSFSEPWSSLEEAQLAEVCQGAWNTLRRQATAWPKEAETPQWKQTNVK